MIRNDTQGEASAAFYDKRRQWIDLVCEDHRVGHATFRVGHWLAKKMNGKDQCCWYSVAVIAKLLGVSTKTVTQATTELETLGLMIIIRQKGKGNTYHIRSPIC